MEENVFVFMFLWRGMLFYGVFDGHYFHYISYVYDRC